MHFAFTEEQESFKRTIRDLLEKACPPSVVRAAWSSDSGRSPEVWAKLAELGVTGLMVPEAHGGLGMSELDIVLILEEAGRAALPDPLLETAVVAAPLLAEIGGDRAAEWLPRIAAGEAVVAVGLAGDPLVLGAGAADLAILERGGEIHAVARGAMRLEPQRSVDGSRRLFRVDFDACAETRIAADEKAAEVAAMAFDRGALGAAAELCGAARRLVDVTVEYVKVRKQFGKPVGSFQAVKHHLADALIALELARPAVYRAAWSMTQRDAARSIHVSMAKARASDAASLAARKALQCHGAIGYSPEHDLHLWMKRVWALAASWGDAAWHRGRVGSSLFDEPGRA